MPIAHYTIGDGLGNWLRIERTYEEESRRQIRGMSPAMMLQLPIVVDEDGRVLRNATNVENVEPPPRDELPLGYPLRYGVDKDGEKTYMTKTVAYVAVGGLMIPPIELDHDRLTAQSAQLLGNLRP